MFFMTDSEKEIESDDITSLRIWLSNYLSDSEFKVNKLTKKFSLGLEPPGYYGNHDELAEDLLEQIIESGEFKEFLDYMLSEDSPNAKIYGELYEKYFPDTPKGTYPVSIPAIRESRISSDPEQTLDPTMIDSEYIQILNAIQTSGINIEKNIITFLKQNEEGLRNVILGNLQTAFPEYSTSGETFNVEGQTDILLKYGQNNLFVAECKIWDGQASVNTAIDQLMGYLTWRDTKTALIIFVENTTFSSILKKIPEIISTHNNHKKHIGSQKENQFNFEFTQKSDASKSFKLAVICFNFYHKSR